MNREELIERIQALAADVTAKEEHVASLKARVDEL